LLSKDNTVKKSPNNEFVGQPFDGLLGDTIHLKVLARLIAEPCRQYRVVDVAEETESTSGTVSKIMRTLEGLRFVEEVVPGAKHPVYRVCCESNKLMALTILALAIRDDRDGSELMNDTVRHYYKNILSTGAGVDHFQTLVSQNIEARSTSKTSVLKVPFHVRGGQA
jgi:hypothetical protein